MAGSESAKNTGATGDRQREGGKINQSLLALNQVFKSLVRKERPNFRDSQLTKVLKHSLSGNAKMAVVCCASPSALHLEETRSTLKYAEDMKAIKVKPKKSRVSLIDRHHQSSTRLSVTSTPWKNKVKGMFASPGNSRRSMCHPHTEKVKTKNHQRASLMSSTILENDNDEVVIQLRKMLATKNEEIASLEAKLNCTKTELKSATAKLQTQCEWLHTQNEEFKSQVSSLEADKDFLIAEKQAMVTKVDESPLDLDDMIPPCHEDTSSRRESTDSDATKEYGVTDEMKCTDPSSADSYDSIVTAFHDSQVKVYELELLVEKLQRENQELKCNDTLPKDHVEESCQTSIEIESTELANSGTAVNTTITDIVCYSPREDNFVLFDTSAAPAEDISSSPKKLDFTPREVNKECQMPGYDMTTLPPAQMMRGHEDKPENCDTISDEKENAHSTKSTSKKSSSSKRKTSKQLTPLGNHNIQSPVVTRHRGRPRRKTQGQINRFTPSKSEPPVIFSDDSKALHDQLSRCNEPFGAVGYMFEKYFGTSTGSYIGIVTEILPDGKRRCNYPMDTSPSGEEVLSLDELPRTKHSNSSIGKVEKRIFKEGEHVWVEEGKATHPAVIVSIQNGAKTAKVRWSTMKTVQDVEVERLRPMFDKEERVSNKRSSRRKTIKSSSTASVVDKSSDSSSSDSVNVPIVGMCVSVQFDDNNKYRGRIAQVSKQKQSKKKTKATKYKIRIQYDDGDVGDEKYPDPDISLLS